MTGTVQSGPNSPTQTASLEIESIETAKGKKELSFATISSSGLSAESGATEDHTVLNSDTLDGEGITSFI